MLIWLIHLLQRARLYNVGKTASAIDGVGKTEQLHAQESDRVLSHTIHKNRLKVNKRQM